MFLQLWRAKAIMQWLILSMFGVRRTYHRQRLWREYRCPECVENDACPYCPCDVNGMMTAPNGRCSNHRWGKMMKDKDWLEYEKENEVDALVIDRKLEFQESGQFNRDRDVYIQEIQNELKIKRRLVKEIDQLHNDHKELLEQNIYLGKYANNYGGKLSDLQSGITKPKRNEGTEVELDPSFNDGVHKLEDGSVVVIKEGEAELSQKEFNANVMDDSNNYMVKWKEERKHFPDNYDLGVCDRGETKKFELRYTGDLTIRNAKGNCTCQAQKIDKQNGIIYAKLKVESEPGTYAKTLKINLIPDKKYYSPHHRNVAKVVNDTRDFTLFVHIDYKVI